MCRALHVPASSPSTLSPNFRIRHSFTKWRTCSAIRPKAISQTQNRRGGIFAKSKQKQLRCCAVKRLAWKERTMRVAIYKIGCPREAVAAPTQFPKRAHRRFSAPRIKSSAPDDRAKREHRNTRTRTCQGKGQESAYRSPDPSKYSEHYHGSPAM